MPGLIEGLFHSMVGEGDKINGTFKGDPNRISHFDDVKTPEGRNAVHTTQGLVYTGRTTGYDDSDDPSKVRSGDVFEIWKDEKGVWQERRRN